MSVLYCRNCGQKIEYTLSKPTACFKCHSAIAGIFSPPKSKKQPIKTIVRSRKRYAEDEDEDDYEDSEDGLSTSEIKDLASGVEINVSFYEESVGSIYRF